MCLPSCGLQNCKDSHDSLCFSARLCPCLPQFGGLQCTFPWAAAGCHHILPSHDCRNFWGLCCCAGAAWGRTGRVPWPHKQPLHRLLTAQQHRVYATWVPSGWCERPVLKVSSQAGTSCFACVGASGSNQWLNYFVHACAASVVSFVQIVVDKTKLDYVQKSNLFSLLQALDPLICD